jgi:hypothetical protein
MSDEWTDYDEGYVQAHDWSAALAAGAALPVVETEIPLEPGEVAHAHVGPVTVAAYVAGGFTYQPLFGIFVTGEVALGRRASWRASTPRASTAVRWHRIGFVDLVVTNTRIAVMGNGRAGSVSYAETGPVELAAGMDGGPALQLRPPGYPTIQLESPWAPLLYVFVHTLADGRPPAVPMPAAVAGRAKATGRLQ